jgi:hypothetical protein
VLLSPDGISPNKVDLVLLLPLIPLIVSSILAPNSLKLSLFGSVLEQLLLTLIFSLLPFPSTTSLWLSPFTPTTALVLQSSLTVDALPHIGLFAALVSSGV